MHHRTQIYLGDDHYRFLREKAGRDGVSLAQAVRTLIEKEMPSEKLWARDPIWRIGKKGPRSGIKDGSRRHHEILRNRMMKNRAEDR